MLDAAFKIGRQRLKKYRKFHPFLRRFTVIVTLLGVGNPRLNEAQPPTQLFPQAQQDYNAPLHDYLKPTRFFGIPPQYE